MKILFDTFRNLLGFPCSITFLEPFIGIKTAFAIVATINAVAKRHDIRRNCSGAMSTIRDRNPMILSQSMPKARGSSAYCATPTKILQGIFPVFYRKSGWQIAFPSIAARAGNIYQKSTPGSVQRFARLSNAIWMKLPISPLLRLTLFFVSLVSLAIKFAQPFQPCFAIFSLVFGCSSCGSSSQPLIVGVVRTLATNAARLQTTPGLGFSGKEQDRGREPFAAVFALLLADRLVDHGSFPYWPYSRGSGKAVRLAPSAGRDSCLSRLHAYFTAETAGAQ